jgi:hypothetical protein
MIIAAHLPVGPQLNVPDAPVPPDGHPNTTIETLFLPTCNDGSKPVGTPCDEGVPIENNDPVPPIASSPMRRSLQRSATTRTCSYG